MSQLFSDAVSYRVPLYQRHYVWDSINWGHLWDDIKEKSELRWNNSPKEHFTGAIVIQDIASSSVLEIIDGQQRLTTFQIIFCAIRDLCDEFDDTMGIKKKADKYIHGRSLNPLLGEQDYDMRYKLLPREGTDRDVFLSLVEKRHEEIVEKKSPIWKAYDHFKREIKTYVANDYEKLDTLHRSIVNDFKVVIMKVTSDDEYAKIFRSINGTGRRLAQFDLLRNDLFLRTSVTERDKLYRKYWHHFEEESNWRRREVVDDFLEHFLKVKLAEDYNEQLSLFDLYELYCTNLTKKLNLSETNVQLVKYEFYDLSRYSYIYHNMHTPNSKEIGGRIEFYGEFKDKLNVVDQLKLFILYISNEFGLSSCELNRVFNLFESYVVRGMLYIGAKGYNSPPLKELNGLFLRALDRRKSLSIVDLVHLLSEGWATDQAIESVFDTGKRQRLPETEKKRKQSSSNLMREFGGRYIFSVLGWSIDKNELFEKFCKKWPSPEVMLQNGFIGELPIVYSRVPVSVDTIDQLGFDLESRVAAETDPRRENYVFVTYHSTKELSEYETDENSVTGMSTNSNRNEIVTLNLKEILFAFPTTAMPSLQSHINSIRDDVKNLMLEPVSKQDAFSTKDWLFYEISQLQMRIENSKYEHWLLPNVEAIVVTRAGHELQGKLKSFNDKAIYMEIDEHIVVVYMHGIYELKRKKTHSKKK